MARAVYSSGWAEGSRVTSRRFHEAILRVIVSPPTGAPAITQLLIAAITLLELWGLLLIPERRYALRGLAPLHNYSVTPTPAPELGARRESALTEQPGNTRTLEYFKPRTSAVLFGLLAKEARTSVMETDKAIADGPCGVYRARTAFSKGK